MRRGISRRHFLGGIMLGATTVASSPPVTSRGDDDDARNAAAMTEVDFIDERWVEHTYFLTRKVTQPERFLDEPVIGESPATSKGTVLPTDDGVVMWYASPHRVELPGALYQHCTRYAVSRDGHAFELPSLGLREHEGTKQNNIILKHDETDEDGRPLNGAGGCSGFCVLDAAIQSVPHARGRYTAMFNTRLPGRPGGLCLAYSDDGLRWKAYPENPVRVGSSDTYNNFFFDERLSRYVAYIRPRIHAGPSRVNRLVGRIESEDMVHWGNDRVVLDTDERDAPAQGTINIGKDTLGYPRGRDKQFYGLTVTPHQDLYLGFASFYDVVPGTMWSELVHSYDGVHWRREPKRDPFIPLGPEGAWDCGMVFFISAGSPVPIGDYWYIYYTGTNWDHHFQIRSMKEKGRLRMIGAVRLKRGRLVGYETGRVEETGHESNGARAVPPDRADKGDLLTRPFEMGGSALFLNADAKSGSVVVEICDATGQPLPGLSQKEAIPIREDGLRLPVSFQGGASVAKLRGQSVRLRIHLVRASVYGLALG